MSTVKSRPHTSKNCHCDACEAYDYERDENRPDVPDPDTTLPMGSFPVCDDLVLQ